MDVKRTATVGGDIVDVVPLVLPTRLTARIFYISFSIILVLPSPPFFLLVSHVHAGGERAKHPLYSRVDGDWIQHHVSQRIAHSGDAGNGLPGHGAPGAGLVDLERGHGG